MSIGQIRYWSFHIALFLDDYVSLFVTIQTDSHTGKYHKTWIYFPWINVEL